MSFKYLYFWTAETRPEWFRFYDVTWNSTLACNLPAQLVVIENDAAPAMLSRIPKPFRIASCGPYLNAYCMGAGRWKSLESVLNAEGNDNDYVAWLDCRDMLVQRDPFDDFPADAELLLFGEGVLHGQHDWNRDDQTRFQSAMSQRHDISAWPVVCAGGMAGKRRAVRKAVSQMWAFLQTLSGHGTDQAALNYVYNTDWRQSGFAKHVDPVATDWTLSGHHFRMAPVDYQYVAGLRNRQLVNTKTGRAYALAHQWDRTQWREQILAEWSEA